MRNRILALVLALCLALTMAAVPAAAEAPVEITVAINGYPTGWPSSRDADFVYQGILRATGVSFVLTSLDDYEVTLNLRVANNEAPDMFYVSPDTMRTYAAQDMLLDLTPYKDNELKSVFDMYGQAVDVPALYYGNAMYMIPTSDYDDNKYYTMYCRKDWVDKMGISMPTTVSGLYDFCTAIANADLDGNGIKDTIGFTGYGLQGLDAIVNPYDTALGNYLIIRDGKVTNTLLQPRMQEALEMIRKFYDAGLMDPDILVSKTPVKANTISGNFGVSVIKWSDVSKASYIAQAKEINPGIEYSWFGPLSTGEEGAVASYGIVEHDMNVGNKFVISADISPEKLQAIFKVINYLCTDEGSKLVYIGQEGVHWNYDSNRNVAITDRYTETNYTYKYQILGRDDPAYLALKFPEAVDVVAHCMNTNRFTIYNRSVVIPEDYYLADMENYVKMQLIAFIQGERPVSEYGKFVQELYGIYDFQRYMDICTEQLTKLGYAN